jgi:hypothetical protein
LAYLEKIGRLLVEIECYEVAVQNRIIDVRPVWHFVEMHELWEWGMEVEPHMELFFDGAEIVWYKQVI